MGKVKMGKRKWRESGMKEGGKGRGYSQSDAKGRGSPRPSRQTGIHTITEMDSHSKTRSLRVRC